MGVAAQRDGVHPIQVADILSEGDIRQGANVSHPRQRMEAHRPKRPAPGTFVSLEDIVTACDPAIDCAVF
jgi:hypothetical protein